MKIAKIEDLHCDAGWRVNSFLKITTDEGIVGWAEYMEGYGAQGLTGVIHKLADRFLIGQDLRPVERITALLYAATRQAPGGINQQAIGAIENALDARRQRIIISRSQVNVVKWSTLYLQAVSALLAIAMVHSDNRLASVIAMGIFATGVAASVLLIAAHDRPFTGRLLVEPGPLLQVMPEVDTSQQGTSPSAKQ